MARINYYDVLGITPNATPKEIKQAYKIMALKHHPDRCKNKIVSEKKMQDINNAYEILNNSAKKREYDSFLNSGHSNNCDFNEYSDAHRQEGGEDFFSQMGFDKFNNVFNNFFGSNSSSGSSYSYSFGGFGDDDNEFTSRKQHKDNSKEYDNSDGKSNYKNNPNSNENNLRSKNLNIAVYITIEEWYNGVDKKIVYEHNVECKTCKVKQKICITCNGYGIQVNFFGIKTLCHGCHGNKKVYSITFCGICKNGTRKENTSIVVKIPKFMNKTLTVQGYGNFNINTMKYGDLILDVILNKHENFIIEENNIIVKINIGLEEFLFGTKIRFKFLDNTYIIVTILPVDINTISIKNKGVPINSWKRGSLLIRINVINNSKILLDNLSLNPSKISDLLDIQKIEDNIFKRQN